MKPTEILSKEHRVIEIVLECLDRMVEKVREGGNLEHQDTLDAVDFIRNFADHCHHGKEEDRLFPAMVRKGVPSENGPIGVMLFEHQRGREFVAGMAEAMEAMGHGDQTASERFAFSAEQYVELLRAHIHKEDQILFPLANRIMTEDDQNVLLTEFDVVEREHMGAGTHEKYLKLAESLAKTYGIDASAIVQASQGGSCGSHHGH